MIADVAPASRGRRDRWLISAGFPSPCEPWLARRRTPEACNSTPDFHGRSLSSSRSQGRGQEVRLGCRPQGRLASGARGRGPWIDGVERGGQEHAGEDHHRRVSRRRRPDIREGRARSFPIPRGSAQRGHRLRLSRPRARAGPDRRPEHAPSRRRRRGGTQMARRSWASSGSISASWFATCPTRRCD